MKIIFSNLQDPGFNLAAEEYFFSQQQDEMLFIYVNNPCVVIGCNQSADFFDLVFKKLLDFFQLETCSTLSMEEAVQIELLQKNKYEMPEWTFRK